MTDRKLHFDQLNLVAGDMDATIAFYRRLGLEIPEESIWRTESGAHHLNGIPSPGGVGIDFDSDALASAYNESHDPSSDFSRTSLGFRVGTRQDVDELHAELVAAGYESRQEPFDAFWGSRYAVIADPDGRSVGLMSPRDPDLGGEPPDL